MVKSSKRNVGCKINIIIYNKALSEKKEYLTFNFNKHDLTSSLSDPSLDGIISSSVYDYPNLNTDFNYLTTNFILFNHPKLSKICFKPVLTKFARGRQNMLSIFAKNRFSKSFRNSKKIIKQKQKIPPKYFKTPPKRSQNVPETP